MTTDFRTLCAELACSVELLLEMRDSARPMQITEDRLKRACAALATPPPEPLRPIPVSERLPEAEECVDELCWLWEPDINGHEDLGHWTLAHTHWVTDVNTDATHWLPYNAIPFPEVTQ